MPNSEVFVRKSADPTFMRNMLTKWTECVARHHEFHTPEIWHEDRNETIWDTAATQIERGHVGMLTSAAWLAGGIGFTEISMRVKKNKLLKRRNRSRFGDFYICSPGYVAFEGEAKLRKQANRKNGSEFLDGVDREINAAYEQNRPLLHDDYTYSPIIAVFVRVLSKKLATALSVFEQCVTALHATARNDPTDLGDCITAYAIQKHETKLPIDWNDLYSPGMILCLREYPARVATKDYARGRLL